MAEPFLSEIRIMSFGFPPKGWALCNGQLLPINQNQALFSLLGTTYGGDGRVNFALPDMRSAFYFSGGAYTTYGSGDLYLPKNWRLLGFMIATSGLFTFAWTTGILIGVMNRFLNAGDSDGAKRVRDAALADAQVRTHKAPTDAS